MYISLPNDIVEKLRVITDKFIATGDNSIIIVCDNLDVLETVFTTVVKKCALLHNCDYLMIPFVLNKKDIECIEAHLENEDSCILGMTNDKMKKYGDDIFSKYDKRVIISIDSAGLSAKVQVRGT